MPMHQLGSNEELVFALTIKSSSDTDTITTVVVSDLRNIWVQKMKLDCCVICSHEYYYKKQVNMNISI